MHNLAEMICGACKTHEGAVNLTLQEGHMQGGPSSRGRVCSADKEGKGFKGKNQTQSLEKGQGLAPLTPTWFQGQL